MSTRSVPRRPSKRWVFGWAIVLLIGGALGACDSDSPEVVEAVEGGFYLEGRIELSPGGPDPSQPSLLPAVSVLRWWHLDDRHYRYEIESVDTHPGGCVRDRGRRSSADGFRPIWRESDARGEGASVERSGGLGRAYVDTDLGMLLRYEVTGNEGRGQNVHAEVTLLDFEPEFTTASFAIQGADGRVSGFPGSSSCQMHGSGGSGMWTFGAGFLRPGYDPEGWTQAGSGSIGGSDCAVVEEWGALERGEGEVVILKQTPIPDGGVPRFRDNLERIDLDGIEGYRATTEVASGTVDELLWIQDGVIARLQTNAAPFEELVRIAVSVEVVP